MHFTPYIPSLRSICAPLGATARATRATDSLSGLAVLFGGFFAAHLQPAKQGRGSRQRSFTRVAVFWAFLGQVLTRGGSCRWALTRLQAEAVAQGCVGQAIPRAPTAKLAAPSLLRGCIHSSVP